MLRDYMTIIGPGINHDIFMQYKHIMRDGTMLDTQYYVNQDGVVYGSVRGKILKPYMNNAGYLKHTLCVDGKLIKCFVHRMIGMTWLYDSYKPNLILNHIDGDKLHNSDSNLEWVTYSENTKHAVKMGRIKTKYTDEQIRNVINDINTCPLNKTIKDIASKHNIDREYLYMLLSRKARVDVTGDICINKERIFQRITKHKHHKSRAVITDNNIHRICELKQNGIPVHQIVNIVGVSDTTVYKILKKYNNVDIK